MRLSTGILACGLLVSTGCTVPIIAELLAGKDEAKAYGDHGLSFSHPASWTVETEAQTESGFELVIVTVEGPDSALVMVQQFRPKVPIDAEEFMADLTRGMHAETEQQIGGLVDYAQGEIKPVERTIHGSTRSGLESRFTLSLLGESVPHTAQLFSVELDDRVVLVFLQVADEDRAEHAAGFDMIVDSLATQ